MASINPIANTALGKERANHLLRRLTFGPTSNDVDSFAQQNITQALQTLMQPTPEPGIPFDPETGNDIFTSTADSNFMGSTLSWWLGIMKNSGNNIIDRMAWFYHTHFTTIQSRIGNGKPIYNQIKLFRYYALGNFKELSIKICYDNAMLVHLDGRLNTKNRPQENFGREFLELYTIGKGPQIGPEDYTNFTEQDVKAATRVLSGFDTSQQDPALADQETGVIMGEIKGNGTLATQHDADPKTFSDKFQNTVIAPNEVIDGSATKEAVMDELQQLADMIFDQEETARHICRKLYRFFVYYDITEEIENDIIAPLAQTFIANDYEIQPVLEQLFSSQHFFDEDNAIETDDNKGAIIKSPLEVVLGTLRFFEIPLSNEANVTSYYGDLDRLRRYLNDQGLNFYEPFEVAGYQAFHQTPGYNRNWITPIYLANRYNFSTKIFAEPDISEEQNEYIKTQMLLDYISNRGIILSDPDAIVQHFVDYLLPEEITTERYDYFKASLLMDKQSNDEWANEVVGQEDAIVLSYLNNFMNTLIQSPEYQLF